MTLDIRIDAHALGRKLTGNETYIRGLLGGLRSILSHQALRELTVYYDPPLSQADRELLEPYRARPASHRNSLARLLVGAKGCGERCVYQVQYFAPLFTQDRVINVVHDISFERWPNTFPPRDLIVFKCLLGHSIRQSTRIVTGSHFSKKEILERYRIAPEKVVVIPYGIDDCFRPIPSSECIPILKRYGVSGKYILFVGNLQPRKNLARLIQAYQIYRSKHTDSVRLVIVGKKAWQSNHLFKLVPADLMQDMVFTGYVEEADLLALYSGAALMAYPSVYEGFGLPPLEAMACGTPVLASNCTAMPEILGNAAVLVDPFDANAILQGIESVLNNPDRAEQLRGMGFKQAAKYRWDMAATKTVEIYQELAFCLKS